MKNAHMLFSYLNCPFSTWKATFDNCGKELCTIREMENSTFIFFQEEKCQKENGCVICRIGTSGLIVSMNLVATSTHSHMLQ